MNDELLFIHELREESSLHSIRRANDVFWSNREVS